MIATPARAGELHTRATGMAVESVESTQAPAGARHPRVQPEPAPRQDERHAGSPRDGVRAVGARGIAAVLVVSLLFLPVYLSRIGAPDIVGDDEAREVGIIQDMFVRGRWLLPRFNDTTFPDKPVLYHWLGAAACALGPSCDERAVRLPSALSAIALVGLTGIGAARLFDGTTGVTATLLLGLTPVLFQWGRSARPDVLLTLLVTGALLVFHDWWRDGARSPARATALGILLGLGVLAKGPVAPAIAMLTIAAFLCARGDLRLLRRLSAAHVLLPFALLGLGWYAVALLGWGEPFARAHLLRRYLGNVLGGSLALGVHPSHSLFHHVVFYPLHLLLVTLPWTPLLVIASYGILRDPQRRGDARFQFLYAWLAAVLLVFMPAALKLRHYLLPAVPAAAMLAAPFTAALVRGRYKSRAPSMQSIPRSPGPSPGPSPAPSPSRSSTGGRGRTLAAALLAVGLGGALIVWLITDGPSRSDRDAARALAAAARAQPLPALLAVAAGLGVCAAAVRVARRRRWRALLAVGGGATLTWMIVMQPFAEHALTTASSLKPFAAVVREQVPAGSRLCFFGSVVRPLAVYVGRPIPRCRRDLGEVGAGGAYLIVLEADLARVRESRSNARIVAEQAGRVGNLTRGRVVLVEVPRPAN